MKADSTTGLRVRLLLFMLLILFPTLGFILFMVIHQRGNATEDAGFALMAVAWLVGATWVGSNLLVLRCVKNLASITQRLSVGDLSARTALPHDTSALGQLARVFDEMAKRLQLMTITRQRLIRALKTLSAGNRAMVRSSDEQTLLAEMCQIIVQVGGYRFAWIGYAEQDESKTVRPMAQAGFEGGLETLTETFGVVTWADTEHGHGLAGTTIRTVKPYIAQNVLIDPNLLPWREQAIQYGYASAASFPLTIDGKAVGALSIYSCELDSFDAEELELLTGTAQDLSFGIANLRARKEYELTLKHMAYFDSLTGLPNHTHLEQTLQRNLSEAGRHGQSLALLMIDLTRLREINDALGFQHGDQVLREVGLRIRRVLRQEDLVGRMRGDDFAVLLSASDADDAADAALQILDALGQPFIINRLRLDINAVVGISLFPQHGSEATILIRHADVAMHQAKKSGRDYIIYNVERDEDSPQRLAMASELRSAIERNELVLYYQPKVDIGNDRACGVEALVRWNHPQKGMIPPDTFIPIAEHTGLIKPLTEWVMVTALRQSMAWRKAGFILPIAVNLSARNLRDAELVEKLEQMLASCGAKGNCLELEITEGAVMEDPEGALAILKRLNAIGIRMYIDDFGTGYSSLSYLKKLPVSAVKIDKSFVIDMLTSSDSAAIVRSTISLAHDLGLEVVAEGVENRAIWDQLIALNCDVVQGYYIGRPVPAEQLIGIVGAWRHGPPLRAD